MVFVFFSGLSISILLRVCEFFRPTIVDGLTCQDAIFVNLISLTIDKVFKPDLIIVKIYKSVQVSFGELIFLKKQLIKIQVLLASRCYFFSFDVVTSFHVTSFKLHFPVESYLKVTNILAQMYEFVY